MATKERRAELARAELEKIGAPVMDGNNWGSGSLLEISGESGDNADGEPWADYYNEFNPSWSDDFGVHKSINAILSKHGLFAEWINAGVLGVYDG